LNAASYYADFPIRTIFSNEAKVKYLNERLPIRNAVEALNKINTFKSPVAVFADDYTGGLHSDVLYADWTNFKFEEGFNAIKSEKDLRRFLRQYGVEYIILQDDWSFKGCCSDFKNRFNFLQNISNDISTYNNIHIRKLNDQDLFSSELLENLNFNDSKYWSFNKAKEIDVSDKSLLVSVNSFATRKITVNQNIRYLNSIVAMCLEQKTYGRLQVNWYDKHNVYLGTNIKPFECSDRWETYTSEIRSPIGAAYAEIYAAGHYNQKLKMKSISLKQ
jgi:hypothetical protein